MSEAEAKPMMPIILSGAIGAFTILDAFVLTGDTGDLVKIGAGFGSIIVSASLLLAGGLSMPSRRKEEPEPEPEQKF